MTKDASTGTEELKLHKHFCSKCQKLYECENEWVDCPPYYCDSCLELYRDSIRRA